MKTTAIIYWSGTGNTEIMAEAIAEGAKSVSQNAALFTVTEISADAAAGYDILILGCPAMGAEVLEEDEFEPFFSELEEKLSGKTVYLFGSYGWGDGEWMRNWEERTRNAGATLPCEGLTVNEMPDENALEKCRKLGEDAAR